jgi:hypothetical protein
MNNTTLYTSPTRAASPLIITLLILAFTAVGFLIFLLPFQFPPAHETLALSYRAGFNNRVASAIAVLAAILTCFAAYKLRLVEFRNSTVPTGSFLSRKWLYAWGIVYVSFFMTLILVVSGSPVVYAEVPYNLSRLDLVSRFGLVPFRYFEYAYGPLLIYPGAVIAKLGFRTETAYYINVFISELLGLGLTYWIINRLIPGMKLKVWLFCLFAFWGLNPSMGIAYTAVRYVAPLAGLIILSEIQNPLNRLLFLFCSGLLVIGISPEAGTAYMAGAAASAVLLGPWRLSSWLEATLVCAPLAVMAAIYGEGYLLIFKTNLSGYFNFVVAPASDIWFLLIATIVIVPLGLWELLEKSGLPKRLILSLWITSLVSTIPALGRCDFGHVFAYGSGTILLSFMIAARVSPLFQRVWLGLLLAIFALFWANEYRYYTPEILSALNGTARTTLPPEKRDRLLAFERRLFAFEPRLSAKIANSMSEVISLTPQDIQEVPQGQRIATPFQLDKLTDEFLKNSGRYAPEYFPGLVDVSDAAAESRKIADLDKNPWALTPKVPDYYDEGPKTMENLLLVRLNYREYRSHFIPGPRITEHLERDWKLEKVLPRHNLYRNPRWIQNPAESR